MRPAILSRCPRWMSSGQMNMPPPRIKTCLVRLCLFLPFLLMGCNPAVSKAPFACPPGSSYQEIDSSEGLRHYLLHVPSSYQPGNPTPLVIGLHGAGSNAAQFERYTGFSALSDQEGFIAVYPEAVAGPASWNTLAGSPDISFLRDLIDKLRIACSLDSARIYAVGHSRGGGLANRLGCDLSDRIAAVGSVAGAYEYSQDCRPSRPLAVIAFHGTEDPVIPYNGIPPRMPPETYTVIGTPILEWAAGWAARNGCREAPGVTPETDRLTKREWTGCRLGGAVVFYTVIGGEHGWPGGPGEDPAGPDATPRIWNFFREHPLLQQPVPDQVDPQ